MHDRFSRLVCGSWIPCNGCNGPVRDSVRPRSLPRWEIQKSPHKRDPNANSGEGPVKRRQKDDHPKQWAFRGKPLEILGIAGLNKANVLILKNPVAEDDPRRTIQNREMNRTQFIWFFSPPCKIRMREKERMNRMKCDVSRMYIKNQGVIKGVPAVYLCTR